MGPLGGFPHRPHIVVTSEPFPSHEAIEVEDPAKPGGKRSWFKGTMDNVMQCLSAAMNFSYSYKRPQDKSWGGIKADGSSTGMLALVMSEEVEFALGPFNMNPSRNKAMDFSGYIQIMEYRILAARGRPTADPWGFLLPLTPLVWVSTLIALLGVLSSILALRYHLFLKSPNDAAPVTFPFSCVRVMLQQEINEENVDGGVKALTLDSRRAVRPGDICGPLCPEMYYVLHGLLLSLLIFVDERVYGTEIPTM
ncbi:uncharacterized protein LOC135109450 [Scylla paramamosain]|uniref:uncharacterized protein LOC135109450 n=1 Tax=Scylla paramamosain TaxID=85552 RepID=UPI0030837FC8